MCEVGLVPLPPPGWAAFCNKIRKQRSQILLPAMGMEGKGNNRPVCPQFLSMFHCLFMFEATHGPLAPGLPATGAQGPR